ncbi:type II toxin-antitoxin system death-on-curing family toxin [Natronoarchaeum mannanilyticum]|uniref:Fido domain-containing protein n=1 Tax=Natronoarchaeum mannanilyticum TaxID=926360 RepID=A0AAV3T7H2_9EURY
MADDPDRVDGTPFDGIEDAESSTEGGGFWYPTVEDIVRVHDDIIEEDPDGEPGIEDRERIQYAVDYVKHGMFGEKPETIHEKAFGLMRLIVSNHWFVDGNKRTALNTTNLFYLFNGYELDYGEDLRAMLKLLAVREEIVDRDVAIDYLADQTGTIDEDAMWSLGQVLVTGALADQFGVNLDTLDVRIDGTDADPDHDDHNG